jgi:hypothetical protein
MIVKHKKNAKKERKSLEIKIKCVILQPKYNKNDKDETRNECICLVVALETRLVARH